MRIISFGDLYIDYYLNNDLVIGICGGKSNANIIANLSKYFDTAFFGVAGSDTQGAIAINSLKRLGVDTSHINLIADKTKTFLSIIKVTVKLVLIVEEILPIMEPKLI